MVIGLTTSTASAQSNESLPVLDIHVQMLNEDNAPPFIDNGSSEFAIALLEAAGIGYQYHATTMARSLQLLETRPNVMVYPLSRTPEREERMLWVGMVRQLNLSLVGLRERTDELPTTMTEATEFSIGVFRGSYIEPFLRENNLNNLVFYSEMESTFAMLERGRFDLFPFEADAIANYASLAGYPEDIAVPLFPLEGSTTELFYALSEPTNELVLQRLHVAFQRLIEDGTYLRIMGREYQSSFDDW